MNNMLKELNDNGYELVKETEDFKIFNNKSLAQLIVLLPKFDYESKYLEEVIEEIQKFRYNKRTMAFIGEFISNKKEVLNDNFWFMKIEGFKTELVPKKTNKIVEFKPVEYHLENGLFYNPYNNETLNIINILKEINTGTNNRIVYSYPSPMEMHYIKYFLLNKVNIQ